MKLNLLTSICGFLILLMLFCNFFRVNAKVPIMNEGVIIDNLDEGEFLFACKRYYNFSARYRHLDGAKYFHVVGIAFTDGSNWVKAMLNLRDGSWYISSGSEIASLNISLCDYKINGEILRADFFIRLDWDVRDHSGIDIYQFCNDSLGSSSGWELTSPKCANVISTLIVDELEISDDRGNTGQNLSISGRLIYLGSSTPPNDAEIKRVVIIDSKGSFVAESSVEEGFFKVEFKAPELVEMEHYMVFVDGRGDFRDRIIRRYAIEFDGINDFLEVRDLKMDLNEGMTIELWFKPFEDRYQPLIHRGGWEGYYLRQNPGGGIYFLIKDHENVTIFDEVDLHWYNIEKWNHIAIVVKFEEELKIFINGEMKASIPCGVKSLKLEKYPLIVGYFDGDIVKCFRGLIDEVRIYSRPLNQLEIKYSYLNGKPLKKSDLELWLSFDEGVEGYVNDISGRGNRAEFNTNRSRAPRWVAVDPLGRDFVNFIADELEVHLEVSNNRIDVADVGKVKVYAYRMFDGSLYDGILELNDTRFISDTVLKRGYTVKRAYGGKYNVTKIGFNDEAYIIWDRIIITEGGISRSVARVGEEVTLWVRARYEYDGRPFTGLQGRIWVNGTTMRWSRRRSRWELNITYTSPGRRTYKVSGVHDSVHNITSYIDEVGEIVVEFKYAFITTKVGIIIISIAIIILTVVIPMIILRYYEESSE